MFDRGQRLQQARLYLVCDDQPEAFLDAVLRGGVDIVQLRMKDRSDDDIVASARRFARACAAHDALFILNDRPDLVGPACADGVHVGQDDMALSDARALIGAERLLGLSTHTPEQVNDAVGADYIGVGPVHATPTKPGRPAVGTDLVRYAAGHAAVPFFAIGGIDERNVTEVVSAGASRIAVVRALTNAEDPLSVARSLRAAALAGRTREESSVGST